LKKSTSGLWKTMEDSEDVKSSKNQDATSNRPSSGMPGLSLPTTLYSDAKATDSDGKTALHYAAASASPSAYVSVQTLIGGGADVKAKDSDGKTALHYAAASASRSADDPVRAFIRGGADVKAKDNDGKTALHHAAASAFRSAYVSVQTLIGGGADAKAKDNDGKTALHYAAASASTSADDQVRALIEHGADVEAKDNDGKTALHYAAASASRSAYVSVQTLIEHGADVKAKDSDGKTALHYAAASASPSADDPVRALIEAGADVEAKDEEGKTALHHAAAVPSVGAMRSLIMCSASQDVQDQGFRTPADCANDSILAVFENQLEAEIVNVLDHHNLVCATLDVLPFFKLTLPLKTSLEIGVESALEKGHDWGEAESEIGRLINSTSLRGMLKTSMFVCKFFAYSIPAAASGSIMCTKDEILGTIGGVLYDDQTGTHFGLTCCHVIPDGPYQGTQSYKLLLGQNC
jgi:ankyrin repeat protein